MAKKYQPAIFQPTVRPDWGGTLSYLSDTEKSEILTALVKYPSVECQSKFWLETIKPDLDLQLSRFMNSNAVKSRGALNRWGKISIPYPNHMDTTSIPYDKDMDKMSNPYGIDTEREREKEKERGKADENSVFHVDCQNFDEIPADILPVMKKYWTDEKIEKIRQDLAFMPSHDSCVATLLTKYDSDLLKQEPKSKATRFVKPTVEEVKAYCEERNNGVDPNDFVNHYDSKGWMIGKSPMKDWRAAVRTWESRNRKPTGSTNVNFAELVMLWNAMAERLNLDKVDESDLMPERKAEIEKIITIKKPKDLKTMFAQLEKIISDSPKLRGWHDILGADGHWITKQLNWKANFAFCFSTKGWCDIMGGKYNGDVE